MRTIVYRTRAVLMIAFGVWLAAECKAQTAKSSGDVLTLEQAVELSLRGNTQVLNSKLDVSKAGEQIAATRTRRLPAR